MHSKSSSSLYDTSIRATAMTGEAADRLAIRKLVDAWAHCADRRLAEEQSGLFVPDGTVIVYDGDPATHEPTASLKGREQILKALAVLNTFTVTTHFNGQSDVVISGDHADGETYCLAHQLSTENGQGKLQILSIRYQDKFVRPEHRWYFVERKLITDWTDTRISTP
jgi:SnoaL-like domain